MKKIAILFFVLGVLVGLFGAFIMRNAELGPPEISDGYYRIYTMQKAYDTETGEPIYWLIADLVEMRGGIPIHQNKIRFYQIPRRAVMNLPDDGKPGKALSFLLTVKNGEAKIDKVLWPPTVFTR